MDHSRLEVRKAAAHDRPERGRTLSVNPESAQSSRKRGLIAGYLALCLHSSGANMQSYMGDRYFPFLSVLATTTPESRIARLAPSTKSAAGLVHG